MLDSAPPPHRNGKNARGGSGRDSGGGIGCYAGGSGSAGLVGRGVLSAADGNLFRFVIPVLLDRRGTRRRWVTIKEFLDFCLFNLVTLSNARGIDG